MDWNRENTDYEAEANAKKLKSAVDEAIVKANRSTDLRQAKGFLIEAQAQFKGLRLRREDRETIYGRLQDAFAAVNKKIEDERNSYENEARMNYNHLREQVDEAVFLASHPKDLRETRAFLIEVQSKFKGLKLLRENREELFARLQGAFEKLNALQEEERNHFRQEADGNYSLLLQRVKLAGEKAAQSADFRETREFLIEVQDEFRNTRLLKEQGDEIRARLQEAFTVLNLRQDEEYSKIRKAGEDQYPRLREKSAEVLSLAHNSTDFKRTRELLRETQSELKESMVSKEQRDELYQILQEAFETLNLRQDEERSSFEKEAAVNYLRLKSRVNEGLKQAEESTQYKETREFLKKIQGEFKGTRLIREQREELYSRLQTSFDILNRRLDEYFRTKKKNWEVKMGYKLSEMEVDVFALREAVKKDGEELQELETQLDIVVSAGKGEEAGISLRARIHDVKARIEEKNLQISELEAEITDLKSRFEGEE